MHGGGAGLICTADDYHRFTEMLRGHGTSGDVRLLGSSLSELPRRVLLGWSGEHGVLDRSGRGHDGRVPHPVGAVGEACDPAAVAPVDLLGIDLGDVGAAGLWARVELPEPRPASRGWNKTRMITNENGPHRTQNLRDHAQDVPHSPSKPSLSRAETSHGTPATTIGESKRPIAPVSLPNNGDSTRTGRDHEAHRQHGADPRDRGLHDHGFCHRNG